MRRRDWLLSTLAPAPVWDSSAAPAPTPLTDVVMLYTARRILREDPRALRDDTVAGPASIESIPASRVLFLSGATRVAALPGSTLKPFVLAALLERKLLKADERLACPGGFRLGRHNLECSHLRGAPPFDAVDALAASCNYWFATMSRRLGAAGLLAALRGFGLSAQLAGSAEQAGLQALGLARVSASPWTLALAYQKLLQSGPPAPVADGLRAAVERGTGQRALSAQVFIAGKTGTAHAERSGSSVGWFAGWAYRIASIGHPPSAEGSGAARERDRAIVFAVRVPGGTGGGEAAEQGRVLAERWANGHLG